MQELIGRAVIEHGSKLGDKGKGTQVLLINREKNSNISGLKQLVK